MLIFLKSPVFKNLQRYLIEGKLSSILYKNWRHSVSRTTSYISTYISTFTSSAGSSPKRCWLLTQVIVSNNRHYWSSTIQENRGKREVLLAEYLSTSKLLHYLATVIIPFRDSWRKGYRTCKFNLRLDLTKWWCIKRQVIASRRVASRRRYSRRTWFHSNIFPLHSRFKEAIQQSTEDGGTCSYVQPRGVCGITRM